MTGPVPSPGWEPARTDRWVLQQRGAKAPVDRTRAYAVTAELEPDPTGLPVATGAIFLTNRECPFRCVMCDLWMHTLDETVRPGDIPHQIATALAALPALPALRQLKLYNAGSFFDPSAIPPADDARIADLVWGIDRIIVESHPAFLRGAAGDRCLAFSRRLTGRLEVAIGLETAHEGVLARLNKRMTIADFTAAAAFLQRHDIDLRVFILLKPPFVAEADGVEWACRSIDLAIECGATACTVIPTRGGNGAMEALGDPPAPPTLASLEQAIEYGLRRGRARVFADTWDLERIFTCACSSARAARLARMNLEQRIIEPVSCDCDAR